MATFVPLDAVDDRRYTAGARPAEDAPGEQGSAAVDDDNVRLRRTSPKPFDGPSAPRRSLCSLVEPPQIRRTDFPSDVALRPGARTSFLAGE